MALYDIYLVLEAANERRREDTISRITAAIRAIHSQFGGKKSFDPYKGLISPEERHADAGKPSMTNLKRRLFLGRLSKTE